MTERQKDLFIKALNGDEESIDKLREEVFPKTNPHSVLMFANFVSQANFLTDEQKRELANDLFHDKEWKDGKEV